MLLTQPHFCRAPRQEESTAQLSQARGPISRTCNTTHSSIPLYWCPWNCGIESHHPPHSLFQQYIVGVAALVVVRDRSRRCHDTHACAQLSGSQYPNSRTHACSQCLCIGLQRSHMQHFQTHQMPCKPIHQKRAQHTYELGQHTHCTRRTRTVRRWASFQHTNTTTKRVQPQNNTLMALRGA